jgi:hypothetical protein
MVAAKQVQMTQSFRTTIILQTMPVKEKSIRCIFPTGKPFPIGAIGKLETL